MDLIKSFIKVDVPDIKPKKQQKQQLPLQIGLDYCNRYRPLFDKQTFNEQIQFTDGQLIEYLPFQIKTQYKNYLKSKQIINYGFWAIALTFSVYCHKIRIVKRIFGQKTWKMFAFKVIPLFIPYIYMETFMAVAQEEQLTLVYNKVRKAFKMYKLTGDITQLNHQIQLFGPSLDIHLDQEII